MNKIDILPFKNELNRKIIHLSSSIIPFFYIFNSFRLTITLSVILLFLILLIEIFRRKKNILSIFFNNLLGSVVRDYEKKDLMSATYLVFSSIITILFFDKNIAILSIFILTICDAVAAVAGMKFGKNTIMHNKTIEGTFAFAITGLFILFFYYSILDLNKLFIPGIFGILVIAIIEHITPTKFDNISIPIFSAILFTIINLK